MATLLLSHPAGFVTFAVSDGRPEESWDHEIPIHIACELMRVRKIHAEEIKDENNIPRVMHHWMWDINEITYIWHASTNRYEICKTEAQYKSAVRWYEK
jgi:hypothetical protein